MLRHINARPPFMPAAAATSAARPVRVPNSTPHLALSVAPMIEVTTPPFLHLLSLLTPPASPPRWTLYTAMIHSQAITHHPERVEEWLGRPTGQRVAQLGAGHAPEFADAVHALFGIGWRNINLNCGCPSKKVQAGEFGAALMLNPDHVAGMIRAARDRVVEAYGAEAAQELNLTIKCRGGIIHSSRADGDTDAFLHDFVRKVTADGIVKHIIIHSRPAILGISISPKQNRTVPKLNYERFLRIRQLFPTVRFTLNGGIGSIEEIRRALEMADGVMVGRKVQDCPGFVSDVARGLYGDDRVSLESIIDQYFSYATDSLDNMNASRTRSLFGHFLRPIATVFHGHPLASKARNHVHESINEAINGIKTGRVQWREAVAFVRQQVNIASEMNVDSVGESLRVLDSSAQGERLLQANG